MHQAINSDWMSNASSGLCIIGLDYLYYLYYLYYVGPLFHILGFKIFYYIILYYTDPLIHILGHNE